MLDVLYTDKWYLTRIGVQFYAFAELGLDADQNPSFFENQKMNKIKGRITIYRKFYEISSQTLATCQLQKEHPTLHRKQPALSNMNLYFFGGPFGYLNLEPLI
jgi:hypothetical protein